MWRVDVAANPRVVNSSAAASKISARAVTPGRRRAVRRGRPGPALVTPSIVAGCGLTCGMAAAVSIRSRARNVLHEPVTDSGESYTRASTAASGFRENYQSTVIRLRIASLQEDAVACNHP